jgi:hypothetical protein
VGAGGVPGGCIRLPPGSGQLDKILVKLMVKPENHRVDHEREVAPVQLQQQAPVRRVGDRAGQTGRARNELHTRQVAAARDLPPVQLGNNRRGPDGDRESGG